MSFFGKNNLIAAGKIQAGKGFGRLCLKELATDNNGFVKAGYYVCAIQKLQMTQTQIAAFRLQNQQITHPSFSKPRDVAAWLGAMQAQDYTHAKWAIGLRIPGSTDADIEAAIDRGDIVRTHVLRPTWHFTAAEDIRWMLALSAPQIRTSVTAMNRQLGLDEAVFKKNERHHPKGFRRRQTTDP